MADGLERCLAEMERRDLDALLLGRESNARFVSGATRLWLAGTRAFAPTCVVVREPRAVHLLSITDNCFPQPGTEAARRIYPMSWNPMTTVAAIAGIDGVRDAVRIGVDGMTPMWEQLLCGALPNAEFIDGEVALRTARRLKTDDEIAGVRLAVRIAQESMHAALDALRPGVRERDLVGVFEEHMASLGTSIPAYEATVSVVDGDGPTRRIASDRVIEDGDLVAMSAGALAFGWEGSLARTWPCGAPTADQAARASRWSDAWTQLLGGLRPGARVGDLRSMGGAVRVFGIGLGYEGLADDDRLEPRMMVGLELESRGFLGQDLFLVGEAEPLTTLPYATFGA